MNGMIAWFAKNPVAANLLMILIMAAGIFGVSSLKLELWPELSVDIVTVTVPYPGAAPEEVEEGVCVRIEEKIQDLEGIKRITSSAKENVGVVVVEVLPAYDTREIMNDIKTRVDAIDTFPDETEKPIIQEIVTRNHVISVAIWGEVDERMLKVQGERMREEVLDLPGITQVELAGVREYEIAVEVSEPDLRRHGLSLDDVAAAVRRSSINLPGGSIKTRGGEILLRTKGQAYRGDEFKKLVLITREDGTRLTLGEVATVVDGFVDTDRATTFNGKPAVLLKIFKVGDQNVLEIARAVKDYIRDSKASLPEGLQASLYQDDSRMLEERLSLLLRNARAGLVLVFLVLALFLRPRLAFWVTLGIPISFLGALAVLPGLDVSLNMISLFSFILVLGIVVDDAIVVGESVHTSQSRGGNLLEVTIRATRRVAVPVIFAVLTTVAAFLPLAFQPGVMGKFIRVIPLVVIPTLLFSLIESQLILPAHLGHGRRRKESGKGPGWFTRIHGAFGKGLMWFARRVYQPVVEWSLRRRYVTVGAFIAVFLITVGLIAGRRLDFTFFPKTDVDFVIARLTMPQGAAVEDTARAVQRLEEAALRLQEELGIDSGASGSGLVVQKVLASVGDQPITRDISNNKFGDSGTHVGEVVVELSPSDQRTIGSSTVSRRWRELTPAIPEVVELVYLDNLFSVGKPVDIQLTGSDLGKLRGAADFLKAKLATYPGVYDVSDSFRAGKREIRLSIKPAAEALGLTLSDVARQVRQGFYGEEAQRVQRGRDDVAVMVHYTQNERRMLAGLDNMRIRTRTGDEVPLSAVAVAEYGRGFATIQRTDRRRSVHVTAEVDQTRANANRVMSDLAETAFPEVAEKFPGVRYSLEGEQREQKDSMTGLFVGFLFSLLMIYALMAIPFKSYTQPLVVMAAIPFGLVGAIWGHVAMGIDLSVMSVLGMVALAGVTVNDSLVLVDYINRRRREEGIPLLQAVREAGLARFRPVLLTSMTTFAGLLPILTETSLQAKFLIPMAASLSFGVIFSTVITLVLVPSGYLILEDLKRLARKLTGRCEKIGEEALTATAPQRIH